MRDVRTCTCCRDPLHRSGLQLRQITAEQLNKNRHIGGFLFAKRSYYIDEGIEAPLSQFLQVFLCVKMRYRADKPTNT